MRRARPSGRHHPGLGSRRWSLVERMTLTLSVYLPRMPDYGRNARMKNGPPSLDMVPMRCATLSRAQSLPCPSNCADR